MMDVLLTGSQEGYWDLIRPAISAMSRSGEVLVIPYATTDWDAACYDAQGRLDVRVLSSHHTFDPRTAVEEAECVFVPDGNAFLLLEMLYELGLIRPLRERVLLGRTAFVGVGSGAEIAGASLRTSSSAPVVEPPAFASLALVPFQIHLAEHAAGVTEDLRWFTSRSSLPTLSLVGPSILRLEDGSARVIGEAMVTSPGFSTRVSNGESVAHLLRTLGRLDDLGPTP